MLISKEISPIKTQMICFFNGEDLAQSPVSCINKWVSLIGSQSVKYLVFGENSELVIMPEK